MCSYIVLMPASINHVNNQNIYTEYASVSKLLVCTVHGINSLLFLIHSDRKTPNFEYFSEPLIPSPALTFRTCPLCSCLSGPSWLSRGPQLCAVVIGNGWHHCPLSSSCLCAKRTSVSLSVRLSVCLPVCHAPSHAAVCPRPGSRAHSSLHVHTRRGSVHVHVGSGREQAERERGRRAAQVDSRGFGRVAHTRDIF